jgi:hypothetical protein
MHKVHQNIIIDGKDWGDGEVRKDSKFCNEGKWENFILPHLPKDPSGMSLMEFGSNAGLFLKMAKDYGFKDVYGLEHSNRHVAMAKKYRDHYGYDYKIFHDKLTNDYDYSKLPAVDYLLLPNLHYHLEVSEWVHLLDNMMHKCRYLILVSADVLNKHKVWRPNSDMDSTMRWFSEWAEADRVDYLPTEGDPHPRDMYSLLYKSQIERVDLDKLHGANEIGGKTHQIVTEFIEQSLDNPNLQVKDTRYFNLVKGHKSKWTDEMVEDFLNGKKELSVDIARNGLKKPVVIEGEGRIRDGGHRVEVMRVLGYKGILARIL